MGPKKLAIAPKLRIFEKSSSATVVGGITDRNLLYRPKGEIQVPFQTWYSYFTHWDDTLLDLIPWSMTKSVVPKLTTWPNIGYDNVQGTVTGICLTTGQFNVAIYVLIQTPAFIVMKNAKFSRMSPSIPQDSKSTFFVQSLSRTRRDCLLQIPPGGWGRRTLSSVNSNWWVGIRRKNWPSKWAFSLASILPNAVLIAGAAALVSAFGGLIT